MATAVNEALVQDYDGTLRVAVGWPTAWNGSGSVSIQHGGKVDVQYESGAPVTVVLEAGAPSSGPHPRAQGRLTTSSHPVKPYF